MVMLGGGGGGIGYPHIITFVGCWRFKVGSWGQVITQCFVVAGCEMGGWGGHTVTW